ncbi:MAG TPA: glycosyltransferase family 4 protein [Ktedonobacterales bacterium]
MSKPRIYFVLPTFLPLVGGAERQALLHCRSFRERGYEVTMLTLRHDSNWPREEVIDAVPVVRVAGRLLGGRERLPRPLQKACYLMAIFVVVWALWRHRRQYDILHIYQLNLLASLGAGVCRLAGTPLVVTVLSTGQDKTQAYHNGSLLPQLPDDLARQLYGDRPTGIGGDLVQLERLGQPAVLLTRSLFQRIGAVVVVLSTRMKAYLNEHHFALPTTQLIPNGVDTARFVPACRDRGDERAQTVVCVSNLRFEKGIDVLLFAWRSVYERVPTARLIIVGDGPLRCQLESLAQTLAIADRVEFAGQRSDVPEQFHRGGVAVLSSRTEGMPNAVLEAMACGLPCVATRVSGSEDLIQHGGNGILCEPGDAAGLAEGLLILLRDPALAQQYGRAARTTIEQHYAMERIIAMYAELYQNLVERKTAGVHKERER